MRLHDFAIVTWEVDPGRLAELLPDGFVPDVHGGRAMVSMVAFNDHGFHFRVCPVARLSCGQVNYRAYVRRGGITGVWFFGFALASRLVVVPRALWKMPWHRTSMGIDGDWSGSGCRRWRLRSGGAWGGADVVLHGGGRGAVAPAAVDDMAEARRIVFDPLVGWYARIDGTGIGRYSVWHEPLLLEDAAVERARCDVFTALGLVEADQRPVSAAVQQRVHFDVHTPPTVIESYQRENAKNRRCSLGHQ